MKTLIIALLIPIGIIGDVVLSVGTLFIYAIAKADDRKKFITEQLIDKL